MEINNILNNNKIAEIEVLKSVIDNIYLQYAINNISTTRLKHSIKLFTNCKIYVLIMTHQGILPNLNTIIQTKH